MTGYIYNGFGKYEKRGKEEGITVNYYGQAFWLPYKKVTAIPDTYFRHVDHALTAEAWEEGDYTALIYSGVRINGNRIVEELTENQQPVKNSERGIIALTATRDKLAKEKYVKVSAGVSPEGELQFEEVPFLTPSAEDISLAETLSLEFKRTEIERYFQSKRERMSGHQGYTAPTGLLKEYMKELGVNDIDQVSLTQQTKKEATPALDPDIAQQFLALLSMALKQGLPAEQSKALAKGAAEKLQADKQFE